MNSCECDKITDKNREGEWSKYASGNDFTESEVAFAKKNWNICGYGFMTTVYKCAKCGQLWGESMAGHGWVNYRKLKNNFEYKTLVD